LLNLQVGHYNARRNAATAVTAKEKESKDTKKTGTQDKKKTDEASDAHFNPRKVFSRALDQIWNQIAASGKQDFTTLNILDYIFFI
jgi:hypothetical protein